MTELARGSARVRIEAVLARELAQTTFVESAVNRAEEAFSLVPAEANRAGALAADAQLRSVITLGLIFARLWFWALTGSSIAHGAPRTFRLLATFGAQFCWHECAAIGIATRSLTRAALSARTTTASFGR